MGACRNIVSWERTKRTLSPALFPSYGRAPGGGVAGASRPRSAPAHSAVASGRLAVVIADSPVGLGCEHQRNRGTDDDRRQTGPADAFGKDPRRKLSS